MAHLLPHTDWLRQPLPDAKLRQEYADAYLCWHPATAPGAPGTASFPDRRPVGWGNVSPGGLRLAGYFANDVPPTYALNGELSNYFDGTTKLTQASLVNGQNDQPAETLLIKWRFTSVSGTQALIGFLSNFGGVITQYGRGIVLDGGSIKAVGAAAANGRILTGPTAVVDTDYVIAARFGSSGALAVNGEIVASGNLGSAWNYIFGIGAAIGGADGNEVFNASGYCSLAYGNKRGFDNGQLVSLTSNPWQLFEPEPIQIYWSTAGGPTYTLTAAQGSFTLTGQAAGLTASRLLTAAQGSYTLTGQAAGFTAARLITAAQGSYTLTGQDATLTYTPLVTYTLTAAQGAFTLTGQAAGLTAARVLTADQGTYSLTGIAAGLSVSAPGTTALVGDGYGLTYSQYQKLLARLKKKDASSPKTKYLWSSKHTRNCPKSGARPLQSRQHQCSKTRTASASMRRCLLERSRPFAPLWPNGSGISRTEKTKRLYC